MSLTYEAANDDMLAIMKAAWDATGYNLHYESVKQQRDTDNDPWAAVSIRHALGQQSSLGGIGSRRFTRNGTIFVQIFTLIGKSLQEAYQLAKIVGDAYEGQASANGVWFRDIRVNEIGRDGTFYQMNVLIDFQYDEIK